MTNKLSSEVQQSGDLGVIIVGDILCVNES